MGFKKLLFGWSRGQMPAFGGQGAVGITTFGQSGNVTVVAPGVAAGAVSPAPPPAPAPAAIPGLGSLADYSASALPAPPGGGESGATFGVPATFGDPFGWSGTITWQTVTREAARGAGELLGATAGGALGAGIGELIVPQGGGVYGALIGGEIGKQTGRSLADRFVDDFFRNPPPPPPSSIGPYRQLTPTNPPVFNPPPLTPSGGQTTPRDLAPIISRQPCAACGGDLNTLLHQRDELNDEIIAEQAQQRSLQQQRTEQELQRFQNLERQPAQTRDIPSELQQKQQLLRDINQQIQDLGGDGGNPPPGTQPSTQPTGNQPPLINQNPPPPVGVLPPPTRPTSTQPGGGQPRTIPSQQCPPGYHQCGADIECEQYGVNPGIRVGCAPDGNPYDQRPAPLFTQREPPPEGLPPPENAVTFCVSCSSQGEALKFLNGEPSECSVLPQ